MLSFFETTKYKHVLLLGASGVGKTKFLYENYLQNSFVHLLILRIQRTHCINWGIQYGEHQNGTKYLWNLGFISQSRSTYYLKSSFFNYGLFSTTSFPLKCSCLLFDIEDPRIKRRKKLVTRAGDSQGNCCGKFWLKELLRTSHFYW